MFPLYMELGLAFCLIFFLYAKRPEVYDSVLGLYRVQPGRFYYLKYYTALIILKLMRLFKISKRSEDILATHDGQSRKEGYHVYCSSEDKQVLIMDYGNKLLLKIPEFSETILINEPTSKSNVIGPILIENLPISSSIFKEKATFSYNGIMSSIERDGKQFTVNIRGEWSLVLPYFNMYWEMSDQNFANSIAKELWSRDYFENFNLFKQIDFWGGKGELKGTVTIDDKPYDLFVNFTQLFSNGNLSLSRLVHRYILHYITTPSGARFCVGVASFTQQFSLLPIGWVSSGCKNYPLKSCDFQLEKHGEGKNDPPKAYHFLIDTDVGDMYNIIVKVKSSNRIYHKTDKFKKIIDPDCTFIVNGEKGWGHVQWYYRK